MTGTPNTDLTPAPDQNVERGSTKGGSDGPQGTYGPGVDANTPPPSPPGPGGDGKGGPAGINLGDLGPLGDLLGGATDSKPVDPTVAAGERAYFSIWGVKPPHGYIKALVESGMNVFEITYHELSKPGATKTQYWRDRVSSYAAVAAQVFGRR